ncbi:hypothetical protein BU15DRAFT_59744 [Melanogaster broomeanus]|nr:hypothetical protein BU15DRAFT_59744 [Melanogaster broomeanus]
MFVISPISALHDNSSASHPHYAIRDYYAPRPTARDQYLAAIAQAEAQYATPERLRDESIRRQLILDSFGTRAQDDQEHQYDRNWAHVCCRANLNRPCVYSARLQELAERSERERQAASEWEARRNEWKKLVAARRQQEEARRTQQTQKIRDSFAARPQVAEAYGRGPNQKDDLTVKDRLESRLMNEYESEIRDTLKALLDSLLPTQPAREPASTRTAEPTNAVPEPIPEPTKDAKGKSKHLALPPLVTRRQTLRRKRQQTLHPSSLPFSTIDDIDATLRTLESEFEFPEELDFAPSADGTDLKLAYTSRNAPLRFYDHALSDLLSGLDAIPSYGSKKKRRWTRRRASLHGRLRRRKSAQGLSLREAEVAAEDPATTAELSDSQVPQVETPEIFEATDNGHTAVAEPQSSERESTIVDSTSSLAPSPTVSNIVGPFQSIASSTAEAEAELKITAADGDTVFVSLDDVPRVALVAEEVNITPSRDNPALNDDDTSTRLNSLSSEHNSESYTLPDSITANPHTRTKHVFAGAADSAVAPVPNSEEDPVLASSPAYPPVPLTVPTEVEQPSSPPSESGPEPETREESPAVDALLLAPSSLSMTFAPPAPSQDDDDAVLVDSEHEDSWSEIDA